MEDFVTIEIAKKLKKKGFKELCTHFYRNETSIPQETFCGLRSNTHHKWSFNSMEVKLKDTHVRVQVNIVDAPTISQVLKWLRKEKELHVVFPFYEDKGFYYYVQRIGNAARIVSSFNDSDTCFDTAELAAIAGIEYCLDNLI